MNTVNLGLPAIGSTRIPHLHLFSDVILLCNIGTHVLIIHCTFPFRSALGHCAAKNTPFGVSCLYSVMSYTLNDDLACSIAPLNGSFWRGLTKILWKLRRVSAIQLRPREYKSNRTIIALFCDLFTLPRQSHKSSLVPLYNRQHQTVKNQYETPTNTLRPGGCGMTVK